MRNTSHTISRFADHVPSLSICAVLQPDRQKFTNKQGEKGIHKQTTAERKTEIGRNKQKQADRNKERDKNRERQTDKSRQ